MVHFPLLARMTMCVTCVGCAVGGIVCLVLASEKTHESSVHEYRVAVDQWRQEKVHFEEISKAALNASISLQAVPGDPDASPGASARPKLVETHVELSKYEEPDPFRGNTEEFDMPTYTSVMWRRGPRARTERERLRRQAVRPRGSRSPSSSEEKAVPHVPKGFLPEVGLDQLQPVSAGLKEGAYVNFTLQVGGTAIPLQAVALVRAVAHYEPSGVYDHCFDRGGVHAARGMCWVYSRLAGLCVQVARATSEADRWELAPRLQGQPLSYGCAYAGDSWEATTYHTIRSSISSTGHWEELPNATVGFDDFGIELRAAADPYFQAVNLTHGTLTFGWTEAEEDVLGIVLLLMAAVLAVRPLLSCCKASWDGKDDIAARRAKARASIKRLKSGDFGSPAPDPETVGMKYAADCDQSQA